MKHNDYVCHAHDGQSYHEKVQEAHAARTDLPLILAAFGYDWTEFMREARLLASDVKSLR